MNASDIDGVDRALRSRVWRAIALVYVVAIAVIVTAVSVWL